MPSLSKLPGKLSRKNLSRALKCLGFEISTRGGKGSHFKAKHIKTQKSITIPSGIDKNTLYYVLKEIEKETGISWDDIRKEL